MRAGGGVAGVGKYIAIFLKQSNQATMLRFSGARVHRIGILIFRP